MPEVTCWCCEHFKTEALLTVIDGNFINGFCTFKSESCFSESPACRNFILRSGLFTKRTEPKIYQKK